MPKSVFSTKKPHLKLESYLRAIAKDAAWPVEQALPTTRIQAKRFRLSASTCLRLQKKLTEEGCFWQHDSGRFYRAGARALLNRPKPLACLLRRLELCGALYRELLEGVSAGAGAAGRPMLMWHDDVLVSHADPDQPPTFADPETQQRLMAGVLQWPRGESDGYILDHVWDDVALRQAADLPKPAVLLYRRAPEGTGLNNVRADFNAAATMALAHLLGRGFERIVPVEPFLGDPAVEEFFEALEQAAISLGCVHRIAPRVSACGSLERKQLVAGLPQNERIALVVPEDHVAVRLHALLTASKRPCPQEVGLLSVMGTEVAKAAGLSRIAYDFRGMGRAAVRQLSGGRGLVEVFPPSLQIGAST